MFRTDNCHCKLLQIAEYFIQVLQRKTEEAAMATKKLKELLEARKASSRDASGMTCLINNNTFKFLKLRRQKVFILVIGMPYFML